MEEQRRIIQDEDQRFRDLLADTLERSPETRGFEKIRVRRPPFDKADSQGAEDEVRRRDVARYLIERGREAIRYSGTTQLTTSMRAYEKDLTDLKREGRPIFDARQTVYFRSLCTELESAMMPEEKLQVWKEKFEPWCKSMVVTREGSKEINE